MIRILLGAALSVGLTCTVAALPNQTTPKFELPLVDIGALQTTTADYCARATWPDHARACGRRAAPVTVVSEPAAVRSDIIIIDVSAETAEPVAMESAPAPVKAVPAKEIRRVSAPARPVAARPAPQIKSVARIETRRFASTAPQSTSPVMRVYGVAF